MSLTLLLDLDDTLLTNPLEMFMPAYVHLLSEHLAKYIDPHKMIPQLMHATDQMIEKEAPCSTLEETFAHDFYTPLGLDQELLAPIIREFYSHSFQTLETCTAVRPAAKRVIEHAFDRGWTVAIATNPLFPLKAMQSRLEWAGISVDSYPYSLVTSYETMHFAKPNPAYYAEILSRLGWVEQPVCMVGNSLKDDLLPAAHIGIPGFWISDKHEPLPTEMPQPSATGTLEELIPWLDQIAQGEPLPQFSDPRGILSVLRSTPAALDNFYHHHDHGLWKQHPFPGEWSIKQILCHMRDVEYEVNLPRFEKLVGEQNPFIPGVDSDRWAVERSYDEQDDATVYDPFCSSRAQLINILANYTDSDWHQTVRHSIFGSTSRLELAGFIAMHDRTHIQQLHNTWLALRH